MEESNWSVDPGATPPFRHDVWVPPSIHEAPATTEIQPVPPQKPREVGGVVAGVVIGFFVALLVGFGAGRLTSSAAPSSVLADAANSVSQTQRANSGVAPLKGDESEPAAEVAKVLAPTAVQLSAPNMTSLGSGFIYDDSGHILTAAHVVGSNETMEVQLYDGTLTEGVVVGASEETDIAVVRIDMDENLEVAPLALGDPVEVGQLAIALGSPYGLDQTVTSGIISAVRRAVPTNPQSDSGGVVAMLQTDAPINPGNSGGMLANRYGQVIGVNIAIITGSQQTAGEPSGNVGVGFAIPIDFAKSVADRIVSGEPIEFGYLGVETTDARSNRVGGLIASVQPGSPADQAGLAEQDVVVTVDEVPISSGVDLAAAVREHAPGDTVSLQVLRDGERTEVPVKVGKAPE